MLSERVKSDLEVGTGTPGAATKDLAQATETKTFQSTTACRAGMLPCVPWRSIRGKHPVDIFTYSSREIDRCRNSSSTMRSSNRSRWKLHRRARILAPVCLSDQKLQLSRRKLCPKRPPSTVVPHVIHEEQLLIEAVSSKASAERVVAFD